MSSTITARTNHQLNGAYRDLNHAVAYIGMSRPDADDAGRAALSNAHDCLVRARNDEDNAMSENVAGMLDQVIEGICSIMRQAQLVADHQVRTLISLAADVAAMSHVQPVQVFTHED